MPQFRQPGPERPFPLLDPSSAASDHVTLRIPHKHARIRRAGRRPFLPFVAAAFLLATFSALRYLSIRRETLSRSDDQDQNDVVKHEVQFDVSSQSTNASRVLRFGHGSVADARDSRYWDRDDRRRNDEYEDDALDVSGTDGGDDHDVQSKKNENELEKVLQDGEVAGSYNEVTRYELGKFEEKDKNSVNNVEQLGHRGLELQADPSDEYDDGLDVVDDIGDKVGIQEEDDHPKHDAKIRKSRLRRAIVNIKKSHAANLFGKIASGLSMKSHTNKKRGHRHGNLVVKGHGRGNIADSLRKASGSNHKLISKVKLRRRPSCEMKLLNSSKPQEPVDRSMKFASFSLQYTEEEDKAYGVDNWEPRFAGYQSLTEREKSFHAHDQKINCGFINGPAGSPSTGFDLAEDDVSFMRSCQIAVSSCIFGNSDHLRSPYNKVITSPSKKSVCFVMFVDENTLETLSAEGQKPDSTGFIGLWKIVVVRNLPYDDMRRVGKIPKFLAHRLFPSARYSIWLDSKLRLQTDPLLILEYFLWRNGYEYAISNHYDRHCVWEEVMQNKKLNKFNHTIIDQQFAFYQTDGLKRFDPSDPNRILPSYVPEGSFIIRAHTPMSNLFSCLWFNEVDRFTPRDQLSFAYTFLKLRRMNPAIPFYLNMFKDCERRSIAKLFRHREENSTSLLKQAVG